MYYLVEFYKSKILHKNVSQKKMKSTAASTALSMTAGNSISASCVLSQEDRGVQAKKGVLSQAANHHIPDQVKSCTVNTVFKPRQCESRQKRPGGPISWSSKPLVLLVASKRFIAKGGVL
jgi:hypothetical protein